MDEINQLRRENGRLKMQLELLKQKIYQVCLSHDHMSVCLNRAGIPMTRTDKAMMEATTRIMKARTTEEVETIYSDMTGKIFSGAIDDTHKKSVIGKVFFFGNGKHLNEKDLGEDLISQIERMIADIDAQIKNLSPEDKELYEKGMMEPDIDDRDLPEDPMDRTDDLKPPF